MKLIKYILPVILLFSIMTGGFAFAVGQGGSCTAPADCDSGLTCISGECLPELPEGPQTAGAVLGVIESIANWTFAIFLAISVVYLVWGAFEFVTGEGNPEKVSSAKKRLLYAVIGMALAFLANGVDDVLRSILI